MIAPGYRRAGQGILFLLAVISLAAAFFIPVQARALTLTEDTLWSGRIEVREDIVVPLGVTLTVQAGTQVIIQPAESTKVEPENLSSLTEIMVRGRLVVNGTAEEPVVLDHAGGPEAGDWAGIIVDQGSSFLRFCAIRGSDTGLMIIDGVAELDNVWLEHNRYGLIGVGGKTLVALTDSRVDDNDYGILALGGAVIEQGNSGLGPNRKKDFHAAQAPALPAGPPPAGPGGQTPEMPAAVFTRTYGDEVLPGTTIWQGRIVINGVVRLPQEGRLIIMPGTVIEFSRKDTNRDTLGENGLMIQGVLIAKGSSARPIIFRSAEARPAPGDWDGVSILGSDRAQNLIEYCLIQDAYRGLHFHFANVAVNHCQLFNNYRAIQFQESLIELTANRIADNRSGIRARDSQVVLAGNELVNNLEGANFYRVELEAAGNLLANNSICGLRLREGEARVTNNTIQGNRFGLLVNDAQAGRFEANLISHNLEAGVALKNCGRLVIAGNCIESNAINGMSIREAQAAITGNLIAANAERGIGIAAFNGTLTENNFAGNGRYAIGLDGEGNVTAVRNWWGGSDLAQEIYDKADDPRLGMVLFDPQLAEPVRFRWPKARLAGDISWHGAIVVEEKVQIPAGTTLTVKPGAKVLFEKGVGLEVHGRLLALGEESQRIAFTSVQQNGPGDWDEILLEHAADSRLVHCDFHNASWGVHSHFTALEISGCRFVNNGGGLRFRSGPVAVRGSLFKANRIAIRAFLGQGTFTENAITANEIGVFVRQGGGGLVLHRNNLFANERYAIRLGDFNTEDVDARENWWGGQAADEVIFDSRKGEQIGLVRVEPVLAEAVGIDKD